MLNAFDSILCATVFKPEQLHFTELEQLYFTELEQLHFTEPEQSHFTEPALLCYLLPSGCTLLSKCFCFYSYITNPVNVVIDALNCTQCFSCN